ncbi:MAG: hypothetical protein ACTHQE_07260 [Thermomicrobiales bacterium]
MTEADHVAVSLGVLAIAFLVQTIVFTILAFDMDEEGGNDALGLALNYLFTSIAVQGLLLMALYALGSSRNATWIDVPLPPIWVRNLIRYVAVLAVIAVDIYGIRLRRIYRRELRREAQGHSRSDVTGLP